MDSSVNKNRTNLLPIITVNKGQHWNASQKIFGSRKPKRQGNDTKTKKSMVSFLSKLKAPEQKKKAVDCKGKT